MKSGVCPKCRSKEIYSDRGKMYGTENRQITVSTFKSFIINNYICLDCLYMEKYLDEKHDLEKIRKYWSKV